MQSFTDIPSSRTLSDSLIEILNNDKTAISCHSGTTYPTTNLQVGMLCYRTDQLKLYQLIGVNPDNWRFIMDLSSGIDAQFAAKLNAASYTAADVLAKLLTVDGAGTGLDADLLDGQHASAFASSTHNHNTTYLGITAKAADADKLDGYDSAAFVRSVNGAGPDAAGNATVNIDLSSRVAKAGDTMTGNLVMSAGAKIYSSQAGSADSARNTGYKMSDGQDIGEMGRSNQYYDDLASNCNGYLPTGNCASNPNWTPPNVSWWTWGLGFNYCANNGQYDGAGGTTYANNAVPSVSLTYDGYYLAQDEIGGGEYRRWYRACNCNCNCASYTNCNCGTTAFNCRTNCNCNCNCNCSTDC